MATVTSTAIPSEWTVADMLTQLGGVSPDRIHLQRDAGQGDRGRFARLPGPIRTDLRTYRRRAGGENHGSARSLAGRLYPPFILAAFGVAQFRNCPCPRRTLTHSRPANSGSRRVIHPLGEACRPAGPTRAGFPHIARLGDRDSFARQHERGNVAELHDYFTAGVRLVWYIDPASRTARAYSAEDEGVACGAADVLAAGEVLPGFHLPLERLFATLDLAAEDEGEAAGGGK